MEINTLKFALLTGVAGFLQATVDLGEIHAEVGEEFKGWLSCRLK